MTNHHPLTDQIIQEELITRDECDRREGDGRANYYEEDFRTGADWQLEQVNAWIDKNVHNTQIDPDHLWTCEILYKLQDHLNKAMRPPVVVTLKGQILDVLNEDTMAMGSQLHRIRKLVDQMENNS